MAALRCFGWAPGAWMIAAVAFGSASTHAHEVRAQAAPGAHEAVRTASPHKAPVSGSDAAIKQLRRALRMHPEDAAQHAHWAALALPLQPLRSEPASASERAHADALLKTLGGAHLADPELAPYVAEAQALRGDFAAALATFGASQAAPDEGTLSALLSVASLADASGRTDIAEQVLRAGLARAPNAPPLLAALGLCLLAQGRAEEAVPLLANRSDLERRAARARFGGPGSTFGSIADLAYAMMASGEPGAAGALLETSCTGEDASACAALRIRAALESEQVVEALQLADNALSGAQNNDKGLLYLQAEAATRLGDFARARAAYTRILTIAPDELRAKQGLESLDGGDSALKR